MEIGQTFHHEMVVDLHMPIQPPRLAITIRISIAQIHMQMQNTSRQVSQVLIKLARQLTEAIYFTFLTILLVPSSIINTVVMYSVYIKKFNT